MNILITGINGFLGTHIFNEFQTDGSHNLHGIVRDKNKFSPSNLVSLFDKTDMKKQDIFENIDVIIHCAFARQSEGLKLAESLNFLTEILTVAQNCGVMGFVNISSQSVYGDVDGDHSEISMVSPDYLYSMAKYASEKIVNCHSYSMSVTNIRLAGLTGGAPPRLDGVLAKFAKNVVKNEPLILTGASSLLSIIDVRDAAIAIRMLLNKDMNEWDVIYNLGNDWQISIIDLAKSVVDIGKTHIDSSSKIIINDVDKNVDARMNCESIRNFTGWSPKYKLDDIVHNIFDYLLGDTV